MQIESTAYHVKIETDKAQSAHFGDAANLHLPGCSISTISLGPSTWWHKQLSKDNKQDRELPSSHKHDCSSIPNVFVFSKTTYVNLLVPFLTVMF